MKDITGEIGPINDKSKYPMYSYERPAYIFWQGAYEGMIKLGKTHNEAITILQSKAARWLLDHNDLLIKNLGKELASSLINLY